MADTKIPSHDKYSVLQCNNVDNILRLLESLQSTPAGTVVYKQIVQALEEFQHNQNKLTFGYAALAHMLMNAYRKQLPRQSLLYLEIELIQKRLLPPVSLTELGALHNYFKKVLPLLKKLTPPDSQLIREALAPLLGDEDVSATAPLAPGSNMPHPAAANLSSPSVELQVNSIFQQRLNKHYREIQELQNNLTRKIDSTTRYHEEFSELLSSALYNLEQRQDENDLDAMRSKLAIQLRELMDRQSKLNHILRDTQSYLHLVGDNSRKLNEELDKVRVLSLTDDLTGLPNRRAFVRRVEDEILRSDRDKSPLTLIMMDIDNFKMINDQFGHAAGDDILRTYASQILTVFRRYDMVSRYGGEEFAVLLPNTDHIGAARALAKIQAKTHDTYFIYNEEAMLVPTFSAGVAVHISGEAHSSLIVRADKALYRAKEGGRDRIEFDTTNISEPAELVTDE